MDSEDLFFQKFSECNVAFYNGENTFIPLELFDSDNAGAYLKLNFELPADITTKFDIINDLSIANVYSISASLTRLFEEKFSNTTCVHSASALISQLVKTNSNEGESKLFAYVQPGLLQLILLKNGRLQFFNSFAYTTPEDFIFYILYVCQHLQLEPETISLTLLGEIVKDSVLYEFTYKYVRNVTFGARPSELIIQDDYKIPDHFYYNLFCMGL